MTKIKRQQKDSDISLQEYQSPDFKLTLKALTMLLVGKSKVDFHSYYWKEGEGFGILIGKFEYDKLSSDAKKLLAQFFKKSNQLIYGKYFFTISKEKLIDLLSKNNK